MVGAMFRRNLRLVNKIAEKASMFLAGQSHLFAKLGAKLMGQLSCERDKRQCEILPQRAKTINTGSEAEVRQNDYKSMNVKRRRPLRSHYVLGRIAFTRRIVRFLSQTMVVLATYLLPFQTMSCHFHCLNVTSIGPQ